MTAAALPETPFRIDQMATVIEADPAPFRDAFAQVPALVFERALGPDLLGKMLQWAAKAHFVENHVENIGLRAIEAQQHVGGSISLLIGRSNLFGWLEQVTGCTPLKAAAGRLVQTRANAQDELVWHDDRDDQTRLLGVVINLSDQEFSGGEFELRRKGSTGNLISFRHTAPGSMMVFAVRPELEHRVSPVTHGGPRRVYAGWFLSAPEHPGRGVFG